ncbi:fibulin-5 [Plakobranchus ocellatus]|uniref:Fibulin-5 n=1 Tax=Plakobranchus ocellatus TaxID=259542 RepID=A0AAV3ZCD9_9GAST|nr:fibulin-5 [Plakobranchus ocellatus]
MMNVKKAWTIATKILTVEILMVHISANVMRATAATVMFVSISMNAGTTMAGVSRHVPTCQDRLFALVNLGSKSEMTMQLVQKPYLYSHVNLDIDECLLQTDKCDYSCNNTDGGYVCDCAPGFVLNYNGHTCEEVTRCEQQNGGCAQNCLTRESGEIYCQCQSGYTLNADGKTCDDVDECEILNAGCEQVCVNTPGSFRCDCRDNFRLLRDENNLLRCERKFASDEHAISVLELNL